MYIVMVRIGGYRVESTTSAEFAALYRAGKSFVRFGKRHCIRVSIVVRSAETFDTLIRFYSLQRPSSGEWVAAQSRIGKYHTHIDFN